LTLGKSNSFDVCCWYSTVYLFNGLMISSLINSIVFPLRRILIEMVVELSQSSVYWFCVLGRLTH
jgi:hypothetical protein